ncbi:DNA polymerase III subunit delta' [Adlercreutzia sp. ZJ304]|uniref:DNA polymerase III subunit n=1 Tax=Adlercreutzia sp. ZJ304 TaxID=2709791 RepID=UPI001F156F82|nr:DNA polymerase III subunit delta' [Adlercreutzia sp. ZJ304]
MMQALRQTLEMGVKEARVADAFESILGQPQVRDLLRTSVRSERITHAYLFTGPAGSNKTATAYALARALLCPKGAKGPGGGLCGYCDNCSRIVRRTHPDVHFIEPAGMNGWLIEQIREIASDVALAPIQANIKVYILDRVDLMGVAPANAFLKTLEEPPDNVVFILMGRTRNSVLPTIVSRCQVIPFRHIPPTEAAGIVSQNTGAQPQLARQAIEACGGSISAAVAFLRASGNERVGFRAKVLKILADIDTADDWHIIRHARDLVQLSKAPLDAVRVQLEQEISANADFLEKSAMRQIEARNKRQMSAKTREYLNQTIDIAISWLRDVLVVCAGTPELVINTDVMSDIQAVAVAADVASVSRALASVSQLSGMLSYNVSPETCIDVLLLEIKDGLNGTGSAS